LASATTRGKWFNVGISTEGIIDTADGMLVLMICDGRGEKALG
jgi:hypothetical protein